MKYRKKVVLLSLILGNVVEQPTPEVHIQQGRLQGRISTDGLVFEYLGIPYGVANDTNRFQAPLPPPSWDGILNAIDEHFVCPQIFIAAIPLGQEDCLKINVYVPSRRTSVLPVMIYIHGGGYYEGSGNPLLYHPGHLTSRGVVVVTFNYRVAALGFLCLGLEGAPGNAGLKDQLAALRWVKKNIFAFGGDPDNITVFGESAGAGSIAHLKLNPLTKGLFKRVIMQSGSSLANWAVNADPINSAALVAEQLGYYTRDPEELLKIYKNATLRQLRGLKRPTKAGSIAVNRVCFMPCIEKEFPGVESIVTEPPYDKLTSGNYTHVPVISGFNDKEGIALIGDENEKLLQEKEELFTESLPTEMYFPTDTDKEYMSRTLKEMYLNNKPVSLKTILGLAEYYGDNFFAMPVILEADIMSRISKQSQYNYVFKYAGIRNIVKLVSGFPQESGASHADDLFYIFKSNLLPQAFSTKDDQITIDRMITMWTNFAKYGEPTPTNSELLPVKWRPSDSEGLKFMYIDKNMYMDGMPSPERFRFWNETYTKFRRKLYKVGENTPDTLVWV